MKTTAIRRSRTTLLGVLGLIIGVLLTIPGALLLLASVLGREWAGLVPSALLLSIGGMFLESYRRSGAYWICPECGNKLSAPEARLCAVCQRQLW